MAGPSRASTPALWTRATKGEVDAELLPCRLEDCGGVVISEVFIGSPSFVELEALERVWLEGELSSNGCSGAVARASIAGTLATPIVLEAGERYVVEFGAPSRSAGPTTTCRTGVARCSTTTDRLTGGAVYLTPLVYDNILDRAASEDDVCVDAVPDDAWCREHGRCAPTPGAPNEPSSSLMP